MDYELLADLYNELESNPKRLKKTWLISNFLRSVDDSEIEIIMLLLQGRVFPQWDKRVLGLSEKLVIKALAIASGASEKTINNEWRHLGDLGMVAEKLLSKKTQNTLFSEKLTCKKVFDNLRKIASLEGHGSTDQKTKLVAQLFSSSRGVEGRYILRTVIQDLRIGVAEGTLRDAIAWAYLLSDEDLMFDEENLSISPLSRDDYNALIQQVQSALDRCNDFVRVAVAAKKGLSELGKIRITAGVPLKVMLAQKVLTVGAAFEKVSVPCAVEYKFDGFRMQIHKTSDSGIRLFTRRLEEVTSQFPDVVRFVEENVSGSEFILDAEVTGYDPKTGKYKAFQDISQRIRRKYDIDRLEKELPVEVDVFDVLFFEGEEFLDKPFSERRDKLSIIIKEEPGRIIMAPQLIVSDELDAEKFYTQSLEAGNEGVMFKKLDAPYKPGSRVGTMIKLKPTLDSFDLAIIGAEWGTGKRSGWLTSFTVACWDDVSGELLSIGRFGTGIKEKEEAKEGFDITFEEITERLKPLIKSTKGREVELKPDVIVEVTFEEVQASPSYSSGYALRFPRFVKLRDDRGIGDMTTLATVESVYANQRGRNS